MFRITYLDFYFYVCWQTEIKTCLDYILDIAHDSKIQDSRTYKLQKREVNFSEVQPIENRSYDFFCRILF